MTAPLVSVIIRAFNCEKYISEAIASVLAQTFQDFEIIIVDDASTDGTRAILQTYVQQDERIKVFRNETNQGPVRTMNIGLQHARGEFVAVNDADDVSLPHCLEIQVNSLKAKPHIALVGGLAYFIDEDGEEIKSPGRGRWERRGPEEVRKYLAKGYSFAHSSVMFRRECIEAIGLYDEIFLYSEDYDMLLRMADTFDVVFYEEPLVKWRWLNRGITGRNKWLLDVFAELARIRSKAEKEGASLDLQQEYNRLMTESITSGKYCSQPKSDTDYYYNIGMMLLKKGKPQKARGRFLQALKHGRRHRDDINLCLRAFILYVLSFILGVINSKPEQALQKPSKESNIRITN